MEETGSLWEGAAGSRCIQFPATPHGRGAAWSRVSEGWGGHKSQLSMREEMAGFMQVAEARMPEPSCQK